MTDAERKLWWHLRRRLPVAGTHFRRQATIGPYYADFACHEKRIVIEVDGGGHAEGDRMAADVARTAYLNSFGYRVLRFWNNDVLGNIEGVMTVIHDTLNSAEIRQPPTPSPSPPLAGARGGRGKASADAGKGSER
jgi:very-short-patch-repair endonuclease